jgi:hypothetical protein
MDKLNNIFTQDEEETQSIFTNERQQQAER